MDRKETAGYTNLAEENAELRRENASLRMRLAEQAALAQIDPLTGAGNRRAFDERLRLEIERSRRSLLPTCLILFDIDEFKTLNDRHGHAAGDAALRRVALALRQGSRSLDSVFRLGGDEFALVLSASDGGSGLTVTKRLKASLESALEWEGVPIVLRVSAGIAALSLGRDGALSVTDHGAGLSEQLPAGADAAELAARLFALADSALYSDKG